jgi:hypothetical protein
MIRRFPARAVGLAAAGALLPLLAACPRPHDTLSTERRIALPEEAAEASTLGVDAAGRLWLGRVGELLALDPDRGVVATADPGGDAVPSVLGAAGDRLLARAGAELMLVAPEGGAVTARWAYGDLRAAAADREGRWIYAANDGGGVVLLAGESLAPLAGWPEVGREATGAAVSWLGDRVYLALAGGARGDEPPLLQVRDAQSGRVLATIAQPEPVRDPVAGPGGLLYACTAEGVVAYRHYPGGLERAWERPLPLLGGADGCHLRMDADGTRLAAFSRGTGGGLALLDAGDGEELGRTPDPPLDAAFGPGGRLYVLEGAAVRVVR